MVDREKVIKAIETHLSTDISVGCDDCTYENDGWCTTRVLADALALLKEQEIVRCKDCKHKVDTLDDYNDYEGECPCYCSGDSFYSWVPDDDWFCANGERREDDA